MSETLQILRFEAGGRAFALEVGAVLGVERPSRWARLPGAPAYVRGVIEVRDQAVPVIDLAARLQLPAQPALPAPPVILIESDDLVGLAVERVLEVEELAPAALSRLAGGLPSAVRGQLPGGGLLLDAEALVDARPLRPLPALLAEVTP